MADDFGHFGKGFDGYVHYNQAFERSKGGGGGGGKKPNPNAGCGTGVYIVMLVTIIKVIVEIII